MSDRERHIVEPNQSPARRPTTMPSYNSRVMIEAIATEHDWGPARVEAHLRNHHNVTVPVETVRWVLENPL